MVVSLGFSGVNEAIKADFIERLPKFHKSRCEGLTLLSSIVLDVRSANLMELSATLPRHIGTKDHRYQYGSRVLSNSHIDCAEIMQAYAGDVFTRLASNGETIVLMMDPCLYGCHPHPLYVWRGVEWPGRGTKRGWMSRSVKTFRFRGRFLSSSDFSRMARPVPPKLLAMSPPHLRPALLGRLGAP